MENKKGASTLCERVDAKASIFPNKTDSPCVVNVPQDELLSQEPYRSIYALIGFGEENAIHKRQLMSMTRLPDRMLRKHTETIRRSGVTICANMCGYYLPATLEEVTAYRKQEERRAKSTFYTLRAAREMERSMAAEYIQTEVNNAR